MKTSWMANVGTVLKHWPVIHGLQGQCSLNSALRALQSWLHESSPNRLLFIESLRALKLLEINVSYENQLDGQGWNGARTNAWAVGF